MLTTVGDGSMLDLPCLMRSTVASQRHEVMRVRRALKVSHMQKGGACRHAQVGHVAGRSGVVDSWTRSCATSIRADSWTAGLRGGWGHSATNVVRT